MYIYIYIHTHVYVLRVQPLHLAPHPGAEDPGAGCGRIYIYIYIYIYIWEFNTRYYIIGIYRIYLITYSRFLLFKVFIGSALFKVLTCQGWRFPWAWGSLPTSRLKILTSVGSYCVTFAISGGHRGLQGVARNGIEHCCLCHCAPSYHAFCGRFPSNKYSGQFGFVSGHIGLPTTGVCSSAGPVGGLHRPVPSL